MFPLYHLLIGPALRLAHRGAALVSGKARAGLKGRREWREQLASLRSREEGEVRVHVHVASVGEFEGARPIIEELRRRIPRLTVTASFFSPSGYQQSGRWPGLDAVCYLPEDTAAEMRAFVDRLDPDLLLLIRYDLWPELLLAARARSIPIVLACGVLHGSSSRLRFPVRSFFRGLYGLLTSAWMVRREDADTLHALAPSVPVEVAGDTRYDRVLARAGESVDFPFAASLRSGDETVLVAGSTWPEDERMLAAVCARCAGLSLVIVQHEPGEEHVALLRSRFPDAVTLSELERGRDPGPGAPLVIDRTGLLSALYRIGDIAWVGGGWGAGVHSVLEPAAYSLPVITGPRIQHSPDALLLREKGALHVVMSEQEGVDLVGRMLSDPMFRRECGERAGGIVREGAGATVRIVEGMMGLLKRRPGE